MEVADVVAVSPDCKIVASAHAFHGDAEGDGGGTVELWDIVTGAVLQTFEGYVGTGLTFSLDGKIVASASATNGMVCFWNTTTGVALQTFGLYWAQRLFFSSESLYLDTYGKDKGLFYIQSHSAGMFRPVPPPLKTPFLRGNWITQGEKTLLWLPPTYRALLAFKENIFVFRHVSGQVKFVVFSNSIPQEI